MSDFSWTKSPFDLKNGLPSNPDDIPTPDLDSPAVRRVGSIRASEEGAPLCLIGHGESGRRHKRQRPTGLAIVSAADRTPSAPSTPGGGRDRPTPATIGRPWG